MIITDIQKEVSGCKVRKSLWDSEIYTYSVSGCQSDRGTYLPMKQFIHMTQKTIAIDVGTKIQILDK